MEFLNNLVNSVNGLVWGPPMLVLILGTGLFLMIFLKFMPLTRIGTGFFEGVVGPRFWAVVEATPVGFEDDEFRLGRPIRRSSQQSGHPVIKRVLCM